jgi:hypothetical protein
LTTLGDRKDRVDSGWLEVDGSKEIFKRFIPGLWTLFEAVQQFLEFKSVAGGKLHA